MTVVSEGQGMEVVSFDVATVLDLVRRHSGDSAVIEVKDGKYLSLPFAVDMVYQPEIDMYTGMPRVKILAQHMRLSE